MKKFLLSILASILIFACAFSGCSLLGAVFSGVDGRDGQDLNIYDIYEEAREAHKSETGEDLSFLDFLREYLHYDFEYNEEDSLQTVMNRSLLSAVGVYTTFTYNSIVRRTYTGSGVIVEIDKEAGDAYVLTNAHVVYIADSLSKIPTSIELYLYGNDDYYEETITPIEAELVNYSISYDLALLKVEDSDIIRESDARAAAFAESEDVYVGERVYTVGNPEGLGISATLGIISKESEFISLDFAEDTEALNVYRVIRTDVAINGGNSGGALFDSSGRIVGIVNSKDSDPENENMGFALCGSYAKRIWKLMRDGYVSTAGSSLSSGISYGIRCAVFPGSYGYKSKAYFDNETNRTEIRDTVVVLANTKNFSAGDVIKHIKIVNASGAIIDELEITRFYNLEDVLMSARYDSKIIYTVVRDGETLEITTDPTFDNYV